MKEISAGEAIGDMAIGGGVMGGLEALNEYVVKPRSSLWGTILDSFTLNFSPHFKGFFVNVPIGEKAKTAPASRWREETRPEQIAWAFAAGSVLSGGFTAGPTTDLFYGGLDAVGTSGMQNLIWGDGGSGHKNIAIGGLLNLFRWQLLPSGGNPLLTDGESTGSLALNALTDTTFEASWLALRSGAVNLIEGRGTDSWRGALHGLYIGAGKQATVNLFLGSRFRPAAEFLDLVTSYGEDLGLEYGPLLKRIQFRRSFLDLGGSTAFVIGRSIFYSSDIQEQISKRSDVLADLSVARATDPGDDPVYVWNYLESRHGWYASCHTLKLLVWTVHEAGHVGQQYGLKTSAGDLIGYSGGAFGYLFDVISTLNMPDTSRPHELFPYEAEKAVQSWTHCVEE